MTTRKVKKESEKDIIKREMKIIKEVRKRNKEERERGKKERKANREEKKKIKEKEKKIKETESNKRLLNIVMNDVLPWIDEMFSEKDDVLEIKISDIKKFLYNHVDIINSDSFASRFRLFMIKSGYNIKVNYDNDTAIIGKPYNEEDLLESVVELDIRKDKLLSDISTIARNEHREKYDYDTYKLVVLKKYSIHMTKGRVPTIRDVVENAIRIGIEHVE